MRSLLEPVGRALAVRRLVWPILLGGCLLVGLLTLALGLSTGFTTASHWPVQAPRIVLAALVALLVAGVGLKWGPRRLSAFTAVVAAVALLCSVVITARFAGAVRAAGGSLNPLSGLVFTSMDAAPDLRETYTVADGQTLSAVVYRPPGGVSGVPVILYIHGGGWTGGNATDSGHDLRWYADRGWLVISVDYRLATESHATWDEAHRDVACALVWTHANAVRWGGDAGRIAVAGDSAGGNLAVNLAYAAAAGRAQSGCGGTVPVPRAVLVQYPAVDPGAAPDRFTRPYLGGPFPDRLRAVSSDTYITAAAPPTLIIEPDGDGLIPPQSVLRFAERARAAGIDVTLYRIPFADHAYDGVAGSLGNQAGLTIRQNYLREHGLSPARPGSAVATGRGP